MKKTLLILTVLFALLLCACGSGDETGTTTTAGKDVPAMSVIGAAAAEKRECSEEPVKSSAEDLSDDLGIEADMYDDFYFSTAGDFVSCETIAVFKAKEGKADTLKTLLENKRQSLVSANDNYNQKNYDMAKKGVVKTSGSTYVYMVVSPNVTDIVKIIEQYF